MTVALVCKFASPTSLSTPIDMVGEGIQETAGVHLAAAGQFLTTITREEVKALGPPRQYFSLLPSPHDFKETDSLLICTFSAPAEADMLVSWCNLDFPYEQVRMAGFFMAAWGQFSFQQYLMAQARQSMGAVPRIIRPAGDKGPGLPPGLEGFNLGFGRG